MHKYYEPTEYEQMLIAAGWVSVETLDEDYLSYIRSNGSDMDYSVWVSMKKQWDDLDSQYRAEINPLYERDGYTLSSLEEKRAQALIRDMSYLEVMLGY